MINNEVLTNDNYPRLLIHLSFVSDQFVGVLVFSLFTTSLNALINIAFNQR